MVRPDWLRAQPLTNAERRDYLAGLFVLLLLVLLLVLFNAGVGRLLDISVPALELVITFLLFAPLTLVFTFGRFNPLLSSIFGSLLFLVSVGPLLTSYTYLTAALGAGLPLYDPLLDWTDRASGLDWRAYLQFANYVVSDVPIVGTLSATLYNSYLFQLFA